MLSNKSAAIPYSQWYISLSLWTFKDYIEKKILKGAHIKYYTMFLYIKSVEVNQTLGGIKKLLRKFCRKGQVTFVTITATFAEFTNNTQVFTSIQIISLFQSTQKCGQIKLF